MLSISDASGVSVRLVERRFELKAGGLNMQIGWGRRRHSLCRHTQCPVLDANVIYAYYMPSLASGRQSDV
jgi:hypothetical protein